MSWYRAPLAFFRVVLLFKIHSTLTMCLEICMTSMVQTTLLVSVTCLWIIFSNNRWEHQWHVTGNSMCKFFLCRLMLTYMIITPCPRSFPGLLWWWISTSECMSLTTACWAACISSLTASLLSGCTLPTLTIHVSLFYIRPTVRRFPGSKMSASGWSGT